MWWKSLLDRFSPERSHAREADLERELQAHLELEEEELQTSGVGDPRSAAHRALGNSALIVEDTRAAWGWAPLDRLLQDVRFASRTMRKSFGYSLLAAIVLALGIGATTAIFTVVNAALLQPLPFEDSNRLVQVFHRAPESVSGGGMFGVAVGNFVDWRAQQHAFDAIALYHFHGVNLTQGNRPDFLPGAEVSGDFFSVLRAKPLLGRTFAADEMQPGNEREIVLSYAAWQQYFGGDRSVVGDTMSFDRQNYTVIGVMPARFRFPGWASVWVPAAWTARDRANRNNHNSTVIARLKAGVTIGQAQAEMDAISQGLAAAYPAEDAGWGAMVVSMHANMVSGVRLPLLVLLGAVAFVLLIACSNVANMVLARTMARRKEIAMRRALGATRGRVLQLVLIETVMLSLIGGTLGLGLARFGVSLIMAYLSNRLPRTVDVRIDPAVLLFAFVVSVLSGVLAGLLPALRFTRERADLHEAMKQGLARTDADGGRLPARTALVVAEVSMCMVLLIGAGLLVRTLWALENADAGFDPHHVVTMALPRSNSHDEFTRQVMERVRALPGVLAAAVSNVPQSGSNESTWSVQIEGQPQVPIAQQPDVPTMVVTPGLFSTLRIPILRGRDFNDSDTADRPRVVIISEATARRFWPNQDALGKRLYVSWTEPEKPREVVGIARDIKARGLESADPQQQMYVPAAQSPLAPDSLLVRTATSSEDTIAVVTRAVHEIDRQQPVVGAMTLESLIAESYSDRRSNMLLLLAFAVLALVLAAAGVYGVLSYSVRRRMREIGIRLALGANRAQVLRMVVWEGMRPTMLGIALGSGAALALGRVLSGMIFGVRQTDPRTFLSVAVLLGIVSVIACLIPAYRATQVYPLEVLRDE